MRGSRCVEADARKRMRGSSSKIDCFQNTACYLKVARVRYILRFHSRDFLNFVPKRQLPFVFGLWTSQWTNGQTDQQTEGWILPSIEIWRAHLKMIIVKLWQHKLPCNMASIKNPLKSTFNWEAFLWNRRRSKVTYRSRDFCMFRLSDFGKLFRD